MKYQLIPLQPFVKALKKSAPAMQKITKNKLASLQDDPWHPGLRTKKNKSWSSYLDCDVFECSVNMNYRILFTFEDDCIIILQAFGSHDILDR